MPEINPVEVIAECIEKCKSTTDADLIAHCISEALGFLQIDEEPESEAFQMLGGAIEDAAAEDLEPTTVSTKTVNISGRPSQV